MFLNQSYTHGGGIHCLFVFSPITSGSPHLLLKNAESLRKHEKTKTK